MTRAGIGPWRTAELLLAGTNEPDYHVDIGPYLEKKVDAILCHKSQIEARDREEMLKGWRAAAKRNKDRRKADRLRLRRELQAHGVPPAPGRTRHAIACRFNAGRGEEVESAPTVTRRARRSERRTVRRCGGFVGV
jgi:hypothetical protein